MEQMFNAFQIIKRLWKTKRKVFILFETYSFIEAVRSVSRRILFMGATCVSVATNFESQENLEGKAKLPESAN
jgi:hypothetical protein